METEGDEAIWKSGNISQKWKHKLKRSRNGKRKRGNNTCERSLHI
jgi:hypothetical protein